MKDLLKKLKALLGTDNAELYAAIEKHTTDTTAAHDAMKAEGIATEKRSKKAEKALEKATADLKAKSEGEGTELAKLRVERDGLSTKLEESEKGVAAVKLDFAIREAATATGMHDLDGLKMVDKSTITMDDGGKLTGFESAAKGWKESKPYLFGEAGGGEDGQNNHNPGPGPKGADKGGQSGGGGKGDEVDAVLDGMFPKETEKPGEGWGLQ